jgi:hypothetical protein
MKIIKCNKGEFIMESVLNKDMKIVGMMGRVFVFKNDNNEFKFVYKNEAAKEIKVVINSSNK